MKKNIYSFRGENQGGLHTEVPLTLPFPYYTMLTKPSPLPTLPPIYPIEPNMGILYQCVYSLIQITVNTEKNKQKSTHPKQQKQNKNKQVKETKEKLCGLFIVILRKNQGKPLLAIPPIPPISLSHPFTYSGPIWAFYLGVHIHCSKLLWVQQRKKRGEGRGSL